MTVDPSGAGTIDPEEPAKGAGADGDVPSSGVDGPPGQTGVGRGDFSVDWAMHPTDPFVVASVREPDATLTLPTWAGEPARVDELGWPGGGSGRTCAGCGEQVSDDFDPATMVWLIQAGCEAVFAGCQHPGGRPERPSVLQPLAKIATILEQTERDLHRLLGTEDPTVMSHPLSPTRGLATSGGWELHACVAKSADRLITTIDLAERSPDGASLGPAIAKITWVGLHNAHHLLEDAELAVLRRDPQRGHRRR